MLKILKIDDSDNVWVALEDIPAGTDLQHNGHAVRTIEKIKIKHKVAIEDIPQDGQIKMYGTVVGKALQPIFKGSAITTKNTAHATAPVNLEQSQYEWQAPDVSHWRNRTFKGYRRADGSFGTRNFWIFIPLVFCENRNIKVLQASLLEPLGYADTTRQVMDVGPLINAVKKDTPITNIDVGQLNGPADRTERIFPNVDGIKFLMHDGGCGGSRRDADMLCKLLATYIQNPNVGGATVLSLGCQNAQIKILQSYLKEINPDHGKPVYYFEQQSSTSERDFMSSILKSTFEGLKEINEIQREEAPISKLTLGLECGGSDGFSGLSANPALGHCSDLLAALGAKTILAEFPELNGAEQDLINRCKDQNSAHKFVHLMDSYHNRAKANGSGFDANPSPGNIRDGLITDAIKSLGAAKKGGKSPVSDVLDYGEKANKSGLHLLCTPGNDVESTTGLASGGANLIVFTTGLGTPTGNIVAPTLKMSTNNALAKRMNDIIDINAGTIISGENTIEEKGEELLELLLASASGDYIPAAERLGQDDFIPWKRDISL
ncbi:MAG: altronate dehydratase [Saprospiraceae bacterium]|nr:altronate dehydratase [Saprospiraceae bacterium]